METPPKILLDSSCLIFAFDVWRCNSFLVVSLVIDGQLNAYTTENVLFEVRKYFRRKKDDKFAFFVEGLIRDNIVVVKPDEIQNQMQWLKDKINEKDLPQLAAVKALGLKYLIAIDRDFEPFEEYRTPKQFLKELGLKAFESDY